MRPQARAPRGAQLLSGCICPEGALPRLGMVREPGQRLGALSLRVPAACVPLHPSLGL